MQVGIQPVQPASGAGKENMTISANSATSIPKSKRWLNRLLIGLIAYVAAAYLVTLINIPTYIQKVSTGTIDTLITNGEILVSQIQINQAAEILHMTLSAYAVFSTVLYLIQALGFCVAGVLVLWKSEGDPFRLFTAFILLFFPLGYLNIFIEVGQIGYFFMSLGSLFWPGFLLFLYLFPNGRAVPRWSLWLMVPILALHLLIQGTFIIAHYFILPDGTLGKMSTLFAGVQVGLVLTIIFQVYRYFRSSTPIEKTQTRWFVAGIISWMALSFIGEALASRLDQRGSVFFTDLVDPILALLIPISIVIAVLRYRLWDIDIIIRKTLVYGTLSAALAFVFFGVVTLLQILFQAITDQQSAISIVLSTLAIAALFNPLLKRIQYGIDRRFYRRKYDARVMLETFAKSARNETDLDALTATLHSVVQESIQPSAVSLWLVGSDHRKRYRND